MFIFISNVKYLQNLIYNKGQIFNFYLGPYEPHVRSK